jgi:fibronectin-binding autotransporter adhesin
LRWIAPAAALALLLPPTPAKAQVDYFWNVSSATSGGGSGTWDLVTSNWSTSSTGPLNYTWTNNGQERANFSNTAGTVTIDVGGVTAFGVNFATTGYTITGGTLTLAGAGGVIDTGSVNATINSVIADSGGVGLTKNGTGILTLGGANTYTGATTVSAGVLQVTNNSALGTTAGTTTVASGAAVQVSGTLTGVTDAITLNGTGVANGGALRNTANNNTWSGAITLGTGGARINSDAGTLTISGGISGTGQPLTVGGAGNTTISGAITTGTGGQIFKDGAGTLTLSNNASSGGSNFTATGTGTAITITGGVLSQPGEQTGAAGSTSATGILPSAPVPAYVFIDGGTLRSTRTGVGATFLATNKGITLGPNGGTLEVTDPTAGNLNIYAGVITGTGGLTKSGPGVLAIPAVQTYQGPTVVSGGTLRVRTMPERFPDTTALTVNAGAIFDLNGLSETVGSLAGAGTVNLGSATFTSGGTNASTVFTGSIVQTAGGIGGKVVKTGTGTLTLSGNNGYSGDTTVSAGTLKIGSSTALGSGGAFSTLAGTTVSPGATLDLNGTTGINEVITINGTGVGGNGALINSNTGAAATISNGVSTATLPATPGASTTVTVSGGGGSGAAATASLGLTAASFTINSGTTTYSVAPTVIVSGNGVAAAVLDSNGLVTGVTITSPGNGYTTAPTITFSGGTVSSQGTNPTGVGNAANFRIAILTITNAGSGYTSPPTFTSGTVTFTPTLSSVVLGSSSSVGGAGDLLIAGVVSGPAAAALTKVGAGTLTLTAANTYAGPTTVAGGVLSTPTLADGGANSGIGASPAAAANLVLNGGTLQYTGPATSTNRQFTLGTTGALDASGTGAVNFTATGPVVISASANAALTLTGSNAGANTLAAVLSDGSGGTTSLTKAGAGTWVLTGNNTYTGGTTVATGTLLVNGQTGTNSGTGFGGVTVSSGGTLGGTGQIGGAVTVSSGGTLRGGDATGFVPLTLNNGLTTNSGSNLAVRINAAGTSGVTAGSGGSSNSLTSPTNHNYLSVTAGVTALSTGMNVVVDGTGIAFDQSVHYSYKVAQATGDQSGFSITDPSRFTFLGFSAQAASLMGDSGGAIYLDFTPVPEPGTLLAAGAAGLGLAELIRRRRRAAPAV